MRKKANNWITYRRIRQIHRPLTEQSGKYTDHWQWNQADRRPSDKLIEQIHWLFTWESSRHMNCLQVIRQIRILFTVNQGRTHIYKRIRQIHGPLTGETGKYMDYWDLWQWIRQLRRLHYLQRNQADTQTTLRGIGYIRGLLTEESARYTY
jgi:hypothetical protein